MLSQDDAFARHQHSRMREDAARWLRPDWRRFTRPVVERASRATKTADVAFAPDDSDLLAARYELVWLRLQAALLRIAVAERKYSPDQPRVPAGNPDGGQWTNSDGGWGDAQAQAAAARDQTARAATPGINDPRILSDADPANDWKPGEQYAQFSDRRYSVNLEEEDARGGHGRRDHVGLSDNELMMRVRPDRRWYVSFSAIRARHGTFDSLESANNFVNRVLEDKHEIIDQVANGDVPSAFFNKRFGYKTGREAFRPTPYSEPYLRDTYEVGVSIVYDPRSPRGYRVRTAYPRNSEPR